MITTHDLLREDLGMNMQKHFTQGILRNQNMELVANRNEASVPSRTVKKIWLFRLYGCIKCESNNRYNWSI